MENESERIKSHNRQKQIYEVVESIQSIMIESPSVPFTKIIEYLFEWCHRNLEDRYDSMYTDWTDEMIINGFKQWWRAESGEYSLPELRKIYDNNQV